MQEVRGFIAGLVTAILEIGYHLLPSYDMSEISLKRRKSSKQPTNPVICCKFYHVLYFQLGGELIGGEFVLHRLKEVPAGFHIYDDISGISVTVSVNEPLKQEFDIGEI